jgi:hypothetical protein
VKTTVHITEIVPWQQINVKRTCTITIVCHPSLKVIKEDQSKQLNTPEALLDVAKTNNQAVLFLSKLDVVEEMRTWFIAPDGKITSFGCPLEQWEKLLSGLCVVFREVSSGQTETPLPAAQTAQASAEGATDMTGVTEEAQPHSETGNSLAAQSSHSCTIEFRGWFERKSNF